MKIIVSKFGSHFGYLCRRNKRIVTGLILIFFLLPMLFYIAFAMRAHFLPIAFSVAQSKAKSICTITINEAVLQQTNSNSINYASLFDIQKNASGEITAIIADTSQMNILKSQLALEIQNKIDEMQTRPIGIPLGSLFGSELLAGRGPKIPMKIITSGVIDIDFSNSFTSAGINQTKHESAVKITMTVTALLPTGKTPATVTATVPLTHAVIVGKIPQTYANIQL